MSSPESPAAAHHGQAEHLPDLLQVPENQRDQVWLEHYYQGDHQKQLTLRAVLMGTALGAFMSLSNLYVGLKTGWGLGVAITACILSYAIWQTFLKIGLVKEPMTILENNCMQSTASSAGYSTGGTMVSAIAAYLLITGENMPFWTLFWWTAFLALLGVSMAVPMKRQMINLEQLKFPSGLAAAETLKSLHASGGEAMQKAKGLFGALAAGVGIKWLIDGQPLLMAKLAAKKVLVLGEGSFLGKIVEWLGAVSDNGGMLLTFGLGKRTAGAFNLAIPVDPMMMAAGAIVGMRTALSMAIGAVIVYGVMAPQLDEAGVYKEMKIGDLTAQVHALETKAAALPAADQPKVQEKVAKLKEKIAEVEQKGVAPAGMVRKWSLWGGSAMMVTAGLTAFAFQWRSIVAALAGLGTLLRRRKGDGQEDKLASIEVPTSWTAAALVVSAIGCIAVLQIQWGVQWYWGIAAVLLSFVLSLVACRATGETDITPIGAMGKVTQLFYGVTIPNNAVANLMTAGVTAGAAGASADLLTDLKSGYLLGANARKQFLAQAYGIIGGTLVVVPVWYVLVPNAQAIGAESKVFPAPAAEIWASVSKLLSQGVASLHPTIIPAMAIGAALGIGITLAEQLAPPKVRKWLPSATGLGLACVINFADSIAFLFGALAAYLYDKASPKNADLYVVPVASGIIAGESVLGIGIALASAGGIL